MEDIRQNYNPYRYYEGNQELKEILDQLRDGFFSPEDPNLFADIVDDLKYNDQ